MLQSPWHTSAPFQPFLAMPARVTSASPVMVSPLPPALTHTDNFTKAAASSSSSIQTAALPLATFNSSKPAASAKIKHWLKGAGIILAGFSFGFAGSIKGLELLVLTGATATSAFIIRNGLQAKHKLQQNSLLP